MPQPLNKRKGFQGLRPWIAILLVALALAIVGFALFGPVKAVSGPLDKDTVQIKVKTHPVRVTCQPSGKPPTAAGCE